MKNFIYVLSFIFAVSSGYPPVAYSADAPPADPPKKEEPEEKPDDQAEAPEAGDEETEAAGPCHDCEPAAVAEAELEPLPDPRPPIRSDEKLVKISSSEGRRKSGMSVASFPWLPVLAVGGGLLAGYFLYKQYQSSKQTEYTPSYASHFPTCRTYAPSYVPGGSPMGTHYYGAGGGCPTSPPAVLPYGAPGVLPYQSAYYSGSPLGYPGYQTPNMNYFGSGYPTQMVGSPSFGQPYGMGTPPPAILPPRYADLASESGRSIASVKSGRSSFRPPVFCPTVNYFGTSLPFYNLCL